MIPRARSEVPSGKFEGTLEVGRGTVGIGAATVTIRHQEPVLLNSMDGKGQLLGDAPGRTSQDFATPLAVIFMGLALYPILVHLQGSGYPFAAAIFLSFGAGITAWRAEYVNSPDWSLTIESGLALLGVVGGATATSALLLLQPSNDPPPGAPSPVGAPIPGEVEGPRPAVSVAGHGNAEGRADLLHPLVAQAPDPVDQ